MPSNADIEPRFSYIAPVAPRVHSRVPRNQVGVKRWYMRGPLDTVVLTTYGAKERRRRRALGKVAKQARKVNRGAYRG